MRLYAIKDFTSGKYYDKRKCDLEEFNCNTQLFMKKSDAMRKIEGILLEGYEYPACDLANELTWAYLEKVYQKPRWFIDVNMDEYALAKASFRLSPVAIEVNLDVD